MTAGGEDQHTQNGGGFWDVKVTDVAIATLTFGLFVVGAVQAYIYVRQADIMRRALIETRRSNILAQKAAKAATAAQDIAERQLLIAGQQTDISAKQHAIGRLAYLSEHRPRIIMRDLFLTQDESGPYLVYSLVNVGGSEAKLAESWFFIERVDSKTALRNPRSAGHDDLGQLTFEVGEVHDCELRMSKVDLDSLKMAADPADTPDNLKSIASLIGGLSTYFVGALVYTDAVGKRRRSVFRRAFDPKKFTFRRMADEGDYEYAD